MKTARIAVIAGDGIGREVMSEGLRVLQAAASRYSLPLQFKEGTTAQTLQLDGSEVYDVIGLSPALKPQQDVTLRITRKSGAIEDVAVRCRIDTPIEIDYYQHGGILPYVLRQIVART